MLGLTLVASQSVAAGTSSSQDAMEASLICRQAYPDETPTARSLATSTTLVCRPIAISMRMSDGSMKIIGSVGAKPQPGPDLSKALTPQQVQEACAKWLDSLFHISHTS
jgi:hypothetical protein